MRLSVASSLVLIATAAAAAIDTSSLELSAFSASQANISLWLSAATYCDRSVYKTRTYKGPTTGFVATYVIFDSKLDTNGLIGYLPSDKSIYVAYRGSQSYRNWIANLDAVKTSYTSFPECNCKVHKGFYAAEQAVIAGVITEVKRLRALYPTYAVKVTGHSLGAALAQLTSMDLVKAGIPCSVYDFGQPRTGDKAYAMFANAHVNTFRLVHDKDQVPHLPFTTEMDFYHVCTEVFEDVNHKLRVCDSSCEDPTCGDQYAFSQTNWDDHPYYLNQGVYCSTVS